MKFENLKISENIKKNLDEKKVVKKLKRTFLTLGLTTMIASMMPITTSA